MHIVITGGGTGGHIFPALEIAHELLDQQKGIRVSYVGNSGGLEEGLAEKAGLHFFGLKTVKFVGTGTFAKLKALFYFTGAFLKSCWFLLKDRPRAVIGVGGYVSAPMVLASFFLGIPRFICEQNVVPGLANRVLAKLATRVFISFHESAQYFPKNSVIFSGNPIRKQFFAVERTVPEHELKILITGGSMGASFLNDAIPKAFRLLRQDRLKITVTHQTGRDKLSQVKKAYTDAHINAQVVTFIENMPEYFKTHDLLISRAGATVIAEIMAASMPAILVPYRFANGHQRENALALANKHACVMLEEGENFEYELAKIIRNFYENPQDLSLMGQKAKAMATPHASANIVKMVLKLCR